MGGIQCGKPTSNPQLSTAGKSPKGSKAACDVRGWAHVGGGR